MGPVEQGLRTSLTELGILEPTTVYECLAVTLAQIMDGTSDVYQADRDKTGISSISRELRLTLERIEIQSPKKDERDEIAEKY